MITFFIKDLPEEAIRHERVIRNHYLSACNKSNKWTKVRWEKDDQLEINILAQYYPRSNCTEERLQQIFESGKKPMKQPDIHSITAAVLDALLGVAYYVETQIVSYTVRKKYVKDQNHVGLKVTLK